MKSIVFTIILLISTQHVSAQNERDSSVVKTKDTTHSFKKAALFSAVLPGAGQVYNHIAMPKGKRNAFWKVPLIYAGLGVTGYFMIKNNQLQKALKQEYIFREEHDFLLTNDSRWEQYDSQGVLTLYQKHQNQRDLLIIGFGVVYVLQVLDAAVEAHFTRFDISEDLSLRISPTTFGMNSVGVKFAFKFR